MKNHHLAHGVFSLVALFGFGISPWLHAQAPAGNPAFELRRIHVEQPKSPSFNGDKSFSYTESPENWLQVVCEFRVGDPAGWLDNVTFRWHIHLQGAETERLVLTKSVTYDKVQADGRSDQRAVVYLSPRDIRRYYSARNSSISSNKVIVFIEIVIDGIKIGEFLHPQRLPADVPPQWWLSRQVTRIDNILLSRIESPWAAMDHDTWLPERPSEKPVAR